MSGCKHSNDENEMQPIIRQEIGNVYWLLKHIYLQSIELRSLETRNSATEGPSSIKLLIETYNRLPKVAGSFLCRSNWER